MRLLAGPARQLFGVNFLSGIGERKDWTLARVVTVTVVRLAGLGVNSSFSCTFQFGKQ